jgi:uncharacterized protein (UPF0335 family)
MSESAERLRLHVEAIERLESEKAGIGEDLKERYSLAKSEGFDAKALRRVVRERKKERQKREEEEAIFQTYGQQLGLFS